MASDKQDAPSAIAQPESADNTAQNHHKAPENARAASKNAFQAEKESKPKRTTGLKVFDTVLYHGLTNIGVFAVSLVAMYLTDSNKKVEERELGGKKPGKLETFLTNRDKGFKAKAEKLGLSPGSANMAAGVFFSFVYGSLLAPLVKLFEDRRENIAHWIDKRLGTEPKDLSVYTAEPKQSWGSVLGGRLATVSVVVPVATALSQKSKKSGKSLNDFLFKNPGKEVGKKIAGKHPNLAKKYDMPILFKWVFFETFYTAVCTVGLYFSSRFIARATEKKEKEAIKPDAAQQNMADNRPETASGEKTRDGDMKRLSTPDEKATKTWASAVEKEPSHHKHTKAEDWQSRALQDTGSQRVLA